MPSAYFPRCSVLLPGISARPAATLSPSPFSLRLEPTPSLCAIEPPACCALDSTTSCLLAVFSSPRSLSLASPSLLRIFLDFSYEQRGRTTCSERVGPLVMARVRGRVPVGSVIRSRCNLSQWI